MTRYALTLEYDGRPFMGWQRQDHGASVQAAIETAIEKMTGESARVHGAGRTDAGVHALAMRAHVDLQRTPSPFRLMEGLNALLRPDPIAVLACQAVPEDWHARFSCLGRAYEYRIVNRRAPLAVEAGLAWRVPSTLDAETMHAAAQRLVGRHDFTTFRSAHCQADNPVRTLERLDVRRNGERIHVFAEARSFLHHQVRSIVGCLALIGQRKWSADDLSAALEARDRAALGYNAPPDGLYFVAARYPGSGDNIMLEPRKTIDSPDKASVGSREPKGPIPKEPTEGSAGEDDGVSGTAGNVKSQDGPTSVPGG